MPKQNKIELFNKIINSSLETLSMKKNVLGVILIGSLARKTADEYSDIDLVVVVHNDINKEINYWESFFNDEKNIIVSQIMEHGNWLSTLVKTDDQIIKVDYDFVNYEELGESLKSSFDMGTGICDGNILFERDRLLSKIYNECSSQKVNRNPDININELIIHLYSAIRMYKRGELFEANDIINQIRDPFLLSLIGRRNNQPFENYRKLEKKYPNDITDKLRATYCKIDSIELEQALLALGLLIDAEVIHKGKVATIEQKEIINELLSTLIND